MFLEINRVICVWSIIFLMKIIRLWPKEKITSITFIFFHNGCSCSLFPLFSRVNFLSGESPMRCTYMSFRSALDIIFLIDGSIRTYRNLMIWKSTYFTNAFWNLNEWTDIILKLNPKSTLRFVHFFHPFNAFFH